MKKYIKTAKSSAIYLLKGSPEHKKKWTKNPSKRKEDYLKGENIVVNFVFEEEMCKIRPSLNTFIRYIH